MRLYSWPGGGGYKVCACAGGLHQEVQEGAIPKQARCPRREEPFWATLDSCSWGFSLASIFMAFAPMGPEASFFEVLDQHRASLLAALKRGGREPAGKGTHLASRYN